MMGGWVGESSHTHPDGNQKMSPPLIKPGFSGSSEHTLTPGSYIGWFHTDSVLLSIESHTSGCQAGSVTLDEV